MWYDIIGKTLPYFVFYADDYSRIQIVYGCAQDNGVEPSTRNYKRFN